MKLSNHSSKAEVGNLFVVGGHSDVRSIYHPQAARIYWEVYQANDFLPKFAAHGLKLEFKLHTEPKNGFFRNASAN